jgi:hypothetical protein
MKNWYSNIQYERLLKWFNKNFYLVGLDSSVEKILIYRTY